MGTRRFRKILIANRGEIALRIMRTCRRMGIGSVAVYSEADRLAVHARFADEAVCIGPASIQESYLSASRVISAAIKTGADAIHPGYGFLSENASFAKACIEAGLEFIGPAPETIAAMGDKIVARSWARNAGIPVIPGYESDDQTEAALHDAIAGLGLPVMLKAAAGGGGRGMRVIRASDEINHAISSAASEATRAFGDGRLFVERLVEGARHVEVQILGDKYGNLLHLFERDCSLQRRHQKVIEETPAPFLSSKVRKDLFEMALTLGRKINYSSAGTVEFLVDQDEKPYFIEVNSRLQVEHPVTEMVTGLDLVALQIEIAEGERLTLTQDQIQCEGHSIEARLCAEDASLNFLPSTGSINAWHVPDSINGLRIDAGVESGTEVGTQYDSLLAKFVSHGSDREDAIRKLIHALSLSSVGGLTTNRAFLLRLLAQDDVVRGRVNTSVIESHLASLSRPTRHALELAAAAVSVYESHRWRAREPRLTRLPLSYRNNPWRLPSLELETLGETVGVSWSDEGEGHLTVTSGTSKFDVLVLGSTNEDVRVEIDGIQRVYAISQEAETFFVSHEKEDFVFRRVARFPESANDADLGVANAPMPGQVLKILVEKGQHVVVGQALVILEAMKMEQTIRAAVCGTVEAILVKNGAVVSPGELLVRVVSSENSDGGNTYAK